MNASVRLVYGFNDSGTFPDVLCWRTQLEKISFPRHCGTLPCATLYIPLARLSLARWDERV